MVSALFLVFSLLTAPLVHSKPFVSHERRESVPTSWAPHGRALAKTKVKARVALTQQNVELGAEHLLDISDPFSRSYGQHWTRQEVADFFAPSETAVTAVREWLSESGIHPHSHRISNGRGSVQFEATIGELESLLGTEYHVFEDSLTGLRGFACHEYYVPQPIKHHIDFITPSLGLAGARRDSEKLHKRVTDSSIQVPSQDQNIPFGTPTGNLSGCYRAVTPECIKALYNISSPTTALAGNELGILSYYPYRSSDLDEFFKQYTSIPQGTRPFGISIEGANISSAVAQTEEPLIDLEAAYPIVYPQAINWYSDIFADNDIDEFLDAVDGSYCTFEGGDVAPYDPTYPNSQYNHTEMCGAYNITNVVSVSYYSLEVGLSFSYQRRQCDEYMKLALQGVTFVFCSGDYGAGCFSDTDGTSSPYSASFPGTCPWVTSVGATQILDNTLPTQIEASVLFPNEFRNYTSTGGFSDVFEQPAYQHSQVSTYLQKYLQHPNSTLYNVSGRAIPDVAANGLKLATIINGNPVLSYGTSVATPIFASIITLINEKRLEAGKRPVGFVNPVLYANPGMFNDVVIGNNTGCSNAVAFNATPGWDPVTGLGTPNFPKMLEVFMNLP